MTTAENCLAVLCLLTINITHSHTVVPSRTRDQPMRVAARGQREARLARPVRRRQTVQARVRQRYVALGRAPEPLEGGAALLAVIRHVAPDPPSRQKLRER